MPSKGFDPRACVGGASRPGRAWSPTARSTSVNGRWATTLLRHDGDSAVVEFVDRTAPDLVVETEITSFDESKIERYGDLGVRELWRLHARKGTDELRVDFLALRAGGHPPRPLATSRVLTGLTPEDVCEAVEKMRFCKTRAERTEAVAAIVRRRQRLSARVREEPATYSPNPAQPETEVAPER